MPDKHARIVTTSSSAAYMDTLHPETFRDSPARKALGTQGLYAQSKFVRAIHLLPMYNVDDCGYALRATLWSHVSLHGGTRTRASFHIRAILVS